MDDVVSSSADAVKKFETAMAILVFCTLSLTSVACENSALTVVSLTMVESFRSAVPLLTMIFAYLAEGRHYRWPVIASVCVIIEHIHARGFLYRDLKPENLLYVRARLSG